MFCCDRYLEYLQWTTFKGVQALLLKGLTLVSTFELSFHALCKMTTMSHLPIVSKTSGYGKGFV